MNTSKNKHAERWHGILFWNTFLFRDNTGTQRKLYTENCTANKKGHTYSTAKHNEKHHKGEEATRRNKNRKEKEKQHSQTTGKKRKKQTGVRAELVNQKIWFQAPNPLALYINLSWIIHVYVYQNYVLCNGIKHLPVHLYPSL